MQNPAIQTTKTHNTADTLNYTWLKHAKGHMLYAYVCMLDAKPGQYINKHINTPTNQQQLIFQIWDTISADFASG